jgi:excinuclease UvrABC helicase subunit UvrB
MGDDGGDGLLSGIENYSRHITGRASGEPYTLIDYFPRTTSFIDESHITVLQLTACTTATVQKDAHRVRFQAPLGPGQQAA